MVALQKITKVQTTMEDQCMITVGLFRRETVSTEPIAGMTVDVDIVILQDMESQDAPNLKIGAEAITAIKVTKMGKEVQEEISKVNPQRIED